MDKSDSPLFASGGYRKLRSYKVAQVIYDATVVFCDRFIDKYSRTHDQMVQAARSGVRNISEGSGAAATSKKSELMLTNVARASLSDELLDDYRSFLVQQNLPVWDKDDRLCLEMRRRLQQDGEPGTAEQGGKLHLSGLKGLPAFVARATPELAANAMICAINQASALLYRQIQRLSQDFLDGGGFSERLYATRMENRRKLDASETSETPKCPKCGRSMQKRTAKSGKFEGNSFWGCSGYPDCNGIVNLEE